MLGQGVRVRHERTRESMSTGRPGRVPRLGPRRNATRVGHAQTNQEREHSEPEGSGPRWRGGLGNAAGLGGRREGQLRPGTGQREVSEGRYVLRTSSPTDTFRVQGDE